MTIDDINLTERAKKAGLSSAPVQDVFYDVNVDLHTMVPTLEMAQHVHVLMNNQKEIVRRAQTTSVVQVPTSAEKDAEIERLKKEVMVLRNVVNSVDRVKHEANQRVEIENLTNLNKKRKAEIEKLKTKIDRLNLIIEELVSPMATASKRIMEVYEMYEREKIEEDNETDSEG